MAVTACAGLRQARGQHRRDGREPAKVAAELNSLDAEVERLRSEVLLLDKITALWVFPRASQGDPASTPPTDPVAKMTLRQRFDAASHQLATVRTLATKVQERASLIVGTLASFVLPLLFGIIGALAYVVRTISDQIKRSTFS